MIFPMSGLTKFTSPRDWPLVAVFTVEVVPLVVMCSSPGEVLSGELEAAVGLCDMELKSE